VKALVLMAACACVQLVLSADGGRDVLRTWPIHREPESFRAIEPSVCRLASGEILVAFSGNRDAQVCPWGAIKPIRSTDDGETWSKEAVVFDGILDDRAPVLKEEKGGALSLTFQTSTAFRNLNVTYRRHYGKIPHADVRKALGTFATRSTDGGKTWSAPERIADRSDTAAVDATCALGDGTYLSVDVRSEKPLGKPVLTATKWRRK